ncbi:UNVERIFIED_CONTAM: hypothetical protein H355_011688 [Colinus virginianus]|nr:hypothetical protein H355_011688 [Colinus virginianus]
MGPAEELVRIAKKLDKMVARKSTEGALDLLKSLTGYTMTIQLLQTTRIGVAVNSMRKHCSDEEVVASAKILIKNWKRLLESSAPPKKEKDTDGEKKEKRLDVPSPNEGVNPHAVKHPKSPAEKHREKHKERRDSADSRSSVSSSSSSPQKRPSGERRPSTGANPSPAPNSSRRSSSDSTGDRANSNKGKVETPRTPGSPPFSPSICLLPPCYLTGDSVRDKCIEMLTAALRMDDDYKEFGVNCERMASEIEDHILWGPRAAAGSWGGGQARSGGNGRGRDARSAARLPGPAACRGSPEPALKADAKHPQPAPSHAPSP